MGARYYDATFGRFITRDTDLSQSPYAYCGGDPVNFSDPSGHEAALPPTFETTGSTGITVIGGGDGDVSNPYPGFGDPSSGSTGETDTVTTSGLSQTFSATSGTTTLKATSDNGQLTSGSASGGFPLGDGFNAIFGETVNQNPMKDQQFAGLSFMSGIFMVSVSKNSSGITTTTAGIGLKF